MDLAALLNYDTQQQPQQQQQDPFATLRHSPALSPHHQHHNQAAATAKATATTSSSFIIQSSSPQLTAKCLWHLPGPELACNLEFEDELALFNHVNISHIGRKKEKNLCLSCHWQGCKVETTKRDHITSHIKIHIPVKPYQCQTCQKSFKRAQDLTKHRRSHDDSSTGTGGAASSTAGTTPHLRAASIVSRLHQYSGHTRRESQSSNSDVSVTSSRMGYSSDFFLTRQPAIIPSSSSSLSIPFHRQFSFPPAKEEIVTLAPMVSFPAPVVDVVAPSSSRGLPIIIDQKKEDQEDADVGYLSDPGPELVFNASRKRKAAFLGKSSFKARNFEHSSIHFKAT